MSLVSIATPAGLYRNSGAARRTAAKPDCHIGKPTLRTTAYPSGAYS